VTYLAAAPPLRDYLAFGDVCEADFLHDIHVRADARAMGTDVATAAFAKKKWNIEAEVRYYIPEAAPREGENFVLAHGARAQAVVLADDCAVETVLGRGGDGPQRRRILFAPIVKITADEVDELLVGNFGRLPLPADGQVSEDYAVDLRRCFMVDARDVHDALAAGGFRVRSLDDDARSALSERLSAYAVRRGPFVAEDSADKFAGHLVDAGRASDEQAEDIANKLVDVVATAWVYEGEAVERAGNTATDRLDTHEVIERLIVDLEAVQEAAGTAIDALKSMAR
jgi:hypothetical protein